MKSAAGTLARSPSGHVFRRERKRGAAWYAKYRLPDGRQVQRKLGPAWSERGRPPAGYFTKRLAEDWLRGTLDEARRGTLAGMTRTGATFADAAAEFMRYAREDRALEPSTLQGYRSIIDAYLLPAFGAQRLEDVTTADVERWYSGLTGVGGGGRRRVRSSSAGDLTSGTRSGPLSNNSKDRIVTLLHGVFARACKLYKRRRRRACSPAGSPPSRATPSLSCFQFRTHRRGGRADRVCCCVLAVL